MSVLRAKRKYRYTEEQMAQAIHEANATVCRIGGDNSQEPWETVPEWKKKSAIQMVRDYIKAQDEGKYMSGEDSHNAWMTVKLKDGWTWGPVKDAEKKTHPDLLPYSELSAFTHFKDKVVNTILDVFLDRDA